MRNPLAVPRLALLHLVATIVACRGYASSDRRAAAASKAALVPASVFGGTPALPRDGAGPNASIRGGNQPPSGVFATAKAALHWSEAETRRGVLFVERSAADFATMVEVNHDHDDDDYKMFRKEDTVAWVVFFCIFLVLIAFDSLVLHAQDEALSFRKAAIYTVFWIFCAASFNVFVYFTRGAEDAINWGTGYLLEWMLSVDNLFVFRSIFMAFKTPDEQKHKALFWGIVGAVIFRMLFFVVEEVLLHKFAFMYVILGVFLVYTGVKIVLVDEEDASPDQDPVVQKVSQYLPYVNAYAPTPKFFARLADSPRATPRQSPRPEMYERQPSKELSRSIDANQPLRATKLLLVVVCLEITDVVFAVDSVSAIVAQIPDLFLAYTACVFAMLGLRATFFVVDELVRIFSLLGYAVAFILVFIGLKLCVKGWIHVPHEVTCFVLLSAVVTSIVASVALERGKEGKEPSPSLPGTAHPEAVIEG